MKRKSIIALLIYGILVPTIIIGSIFLARKIEITHTESLFYGIGVFASLLIFGGCVVFIIDNNETNN